MESQTKLFGSPPLSKLFFLELKPILKNIFLIPPCFSTVDIDLSCNLLKSLGTEGKMVGFKTVKKKKKKKIYLNKK